jgi:hypothetical protein
LENNGETKKYSIAFKVQYEKIRTPFKFKPLPLKNSKNKWKVHSKNVSNE